MHVSLFSFSSHLAVFFPISFIPLGSSFFFLHTFFTHFFISVSLFLLEGEKPIQTYVYFDIVRNGFVCLHTDENLFILLKELFGCKTLKILQPILFWSVALAKEMTEILLVLRTHVCFLDCVAIASVFQSSSPKLNHYCTALNTKICIHTTKSQTLNKSIFPGLVSGVVDNPCLTQWERHHCMVLLYM